MKQDYMASNAVSYCTVTALVVHRSNSGAPLSSCTFTLEYPHRYFSRVAV